MPAAAIARTDHELQMLEAMVDCAHALGMGFGLAAKAETDQAKSLELFDAFNRSFLAVRMGIRLGMSLRAAPKPARADAAERAAPRTEGSETEASETDRPERDPGDGAERERDRDYEPVSLPKFLATLRGVAADATRLDKAVPANLRAGASTLQDLLARATADAATPSAARPGAGVDVLIRPPAPRAALLASASAALAAPVAVRGPGLPRPPPRRSG